MRNPETLDLFPLPAGLPEGSAVERIVFKSTPTNGRPAGAGFDEAHDLHPWQDGERPEGPMMALLLIPSPNTDNPGLLDQAQHWTQSGEGGMGQSGDRPLQNVQNVQTLLTLQGAQVVWSPDAAAIMAQPDRMKLVRRAVLEFSVHECELRSIEQTVAKAWPELESDSPLAFDFNEKDSRRRRELGKRAQQSIALRARLARLTPHLSHPPLFPPTLANQIGERLRERLRTQERLEFLDKQLDVFDRVYEMCSTRVSDFTHSRKGHTLEMIIIVLLAAQLLISLVGYTFFWTAGAGE